MKECQKKLYRQLKQNKEIGNGFMQSCGSCKNLNGKLYTAFEYPLLRNDTISNLTKKIVIEACKKCNRI